MDGHAKMKTREGTVEKPQNLLREWWGRGMPKLWGRGMRSRRQATDWVTHTFREHNKEADRQGSEGACRRMGGHHSHCVARGYRSLWMLGRELWQRQMRRGHCPHGLLWKEKCVRWKCANNRFIEIHWHWGCVFSLYNAFSVARVAREWTMTEPSTPASFLRVVVARVSDAMVLWEHVVVMVRSHSLSETLLTVTMLRALCLCLAVAGRCPPWLIVLFVGGIGEDNFSETAAPPYTSCFDEVHSLRIWDEGVPFVPYERHVALLSLTAFVETLHGTIWSLISPLLTTDDVVRCRTAGRCWSVGCRFGELGDLIFEFLENDPLVWHWFRDVKGNKTRYVRSERRIMESFRQSGPHAPEAAAFSCEVTSLGEGAANLIRMPE